MASKKVSGTTLLHGDEDLPLLDHASVAPPLGVTTTFRTPPALVAYAEQTDNASPPDFRNPAADGHLYSRYTTSLSTRAEHILSKINDGYALTYTSGLTAAYAALVFVNPKRVAITEGYHGCHQTIQVFKQTRPDLEIIDLDDDYRTGDLVWLETPLNPTGEARDIKYYADRIHKVGGTLLIDSTFAPPPLQYPFQHGADIIMHSATKYFGGHSDLLAGVLIVKNEKDWKALWNNRTYTGAILGSLETWLLVRSLKTFHLRVPVQSATAGKLAQWLNKLAHTPQGQSFDGVPGGFVTRVFHSSVQGKDSRGFDPYTQLNGHPPTFSVKLASRQAASLLPFELRYFTPATSLGGVESLIEHRLTSDPNADPCLLRISVGVEEFEDLKNDLAKGLNNVFKKVKSKL